MAVIPDLPGLPYPPDLPELPDLPDPPELPDLPEPDTPACLPPGVFLLLRLTFLTFKMISKLTIFARPEKTVKSPGPVEGSWRSLPGKK